MNNEKRLQQIRNAARYKYPDERIHFIDGAKWADSHPQCISVEDRLPEEVINKTACFTSPIENAPYINVMFCKQQEGWTAFFGYGVDIDSQTTVKFIHHISDATDVLNEKEE